MIDKNIYTEISEVKLLGHGVWACLNIEGIAKLLTKSNI